jgi:hypothetical protein
MAAILQLDYDEIKKLIDQLDFEDKERLARYLDDQTLFQKKTTACGGGPPASSSVLAGGRRALPGSSFGTNDHRWRKKR